MIKNKILTTLLLVLCLFLSLIPVSSAEDNSTEGDPDLWGYTDEDGDGLILVTVPGETYTAYMLIVLDPTRVVLGCRPDRIGAKGYVLDDFAAQFDAVAGINAGGFEDYNGQGNGSTPDSVIVHEGEILCGYFGVGNGFVGLDADGILQVDFEKVDDLKERNIIEGAGFGPVLVKDGEIVNAEKLAASNLNPRTAIGQRADGALLLLVIDGRQPNSLGGSFLDEAELMLDFGAVTANNLDGGSSSLMWYDGEYLNNKADVIGVRNMPSSFLVLKEGKKHTDAFLERFDTQELQPSAEHQWTSGQDASLPDNCKGTERKELVSFAEEYIRRFVAFSADVNFMSTINYHSIRDLVVPDGELQARLYQAFGSFGFVCAKESEVVEFRTESCSKTGDNRYVVEISYDTDTRGRSDHVIETRNMRISVVRTDDKLLAEAMTFY
ncbi:MAG: phosphodiester glycosidase family protein [Eubacteriales bacterium]|nr:phosphodiester glycosidase family protein [Eubacteriales bacterium]